MYTADTFFARSNKNHPFFLVYSLLHNVKCEIKERLENELMLTVTLKKKLGAINWRELVDKDSRLKWDD